MDAEALDSTNVRRYWGNVDGEIMSGWELAVEWDVHGTPKRWRMLSHDKAGGPAAPGRTRQPAGPGAWPSAMTDDPTLTHQFAPAGDDGAVQDFAIAALDHQVARRDREIAAYDRAVAAELRQGSDRLAAMLRALL